MEERQGNRKTGPRARDQVIGLVAVLAVCAALFIYYAAAGLIPKYDALTLFSPYFTLVSDCARSGKLLLWNPYANCGSPDMAYVEMGSFSPVTVLLALATGGGNTGFLVYWICIWGLCGAGMVMLGLELEAPLWAAVAVAVSFMFSGFFLGNAPHTSWLYGLSFLPLIMWRLEKGFKEGRLWPAAEAGALYGLSALAGHPSLIILNGLYLGLWAIGRAWLALAEWHGSALTGPGPARRTTAAVTALVIMLAMALVVLSPAYISFFYESAGFTDRAGYLARHFAIANEALAPGAIATMAGPYLSALKLNNPSLWAGTNVGLTCCYAGALVPALALAALWLKPRSSMRWWVLAMGLFFLAGAVGDSLPVRGWLYDYCLPTRFFRHAAVMRVHFLFSLALLALWGSKSLAGPAARRGWRVLAAAAAVLFAAALAAFLATAYSVADRGHELSAAMAQLATAWPGVIAAALIGAALANNKKWAAPLLLILLTAVDAGFSLCLAAPFMVTRRSEFEHYMKERVRSIDLFPDGFIREREPPGAFLTDFNLISKRPYLEGFDQLSNRFHSHASLTPLETSWSDEPELANAVIGPESRFWFSTDTALVSPSDRCFMSFVARERELGVMPLVLHRPADMVHMPTRGEPGPDDEGQARAIAALPACRRIGVTLLAYTPTRLAFKVNCPEAGWLLVTDRWARGWKATVNGLPVEIMGGDFIFRAVKVGPGWQTAEFRFAPPFLPWALIASWGALLMAGTVSIKLARKKRAAGGPAGPDAEPLAKERT